MSEADPWHFLRQQGASLEAQNTAAELKFRAERKLGALVKETVKRGGSNQHQQKLHDETFAGLPEGIDKVQSHRWQTMAELPEAAYTISRGTARRAGTSTYSAELPPPRPQLDVPYHP